MTVSSITRRHSDEGQSRFNRSKNLRTVIGMRISHPTIGHILKATGKPESDHNSLLNNRGIGFQPVVFAGEHRLEAHATDLFNRRL